ncbi:MAG TPA: hypothetical protein VM008_00850 [Phycisphaerae bacterium]|nr:hypothetical protein [Phycisphaerae bacterium]
MLVPDFSVAVGKVRTPLKERIVSFHRGRADKNLIKLAAQLGFNGVQFQLEGSNEGAIQDFAKRDAKEHLVDYCHSLGMKVTVWVHELSDLPGPWMPEYLGVESTDNQKLFDYLGNRYEWILGKAIPNVDGLVLTVVETQVRATQTPMLLKLCDLISKKCAEHHKEFVLRTFVWHLEELSGVMGAVNQLPHDTVLMSKWVAQDWQMRGVAAPEIGPILAQKRPLLIEWDVEGEYFLHNQVANCMVGMLQKQFEKVVGQGAEGIVVRVDRYDDEVLFQPSEVNLWALGMLASGAADSEEEIWDKWAAYRYPTLSGADRMTLIGALKPTSDVVAELLSAGPFTFGDTRRYPPLPDEDAFNQNWQNWQWDASDVPAYEKAEHGDAGFIAEVTEAKGKAMGVAEQCLADLEKLRAALPPVEYAILRTKLMTNKVQLAIRAPMVLASLEWRAVQNAGSEEEKEGHLAAMRKHVEELCAVVGPGFAVPSYVDYLGRTWQVGSPEGVDRNAFMYWAWETERLADGKRYPRGRVYERKVDPLHP